ncbi:multiubiquitin domain-containing protein [Mesorhizobium sp. M0590]|uniref:multiubiquitin domain-containing protein n=1 Tax=unclassified Mesorhizobium TaxID=325217 RepID=UPI003334D5B4
METQETAKVKDKTVTIIVDGTPYEVPKKDDITYAEVVTLAHPDYPQHPEITYSVTYTRGDGHKPEGILAPGGSVKVKEGMVFSVNRTGQS